MAYQCKTVSEARCLSGILEALRAECVQIAVLDAPDIYLEYAPYCYMEDTKKFVDRVSEMRQYA